ncbi:hypothetical protein SAMN05216436_103221 [bacterium A37T11]|nr:hypothetical protein SAMN05216436_103221 [bacterium A37T11]
MTMWISYLFWEIVALVAAWYFLRGDTGAWRWQRWFLAVVLVVELAGTAISQYGHRSNHWLYNAFIPVHFSFISWFLYTRINVLKPHPVYVLYSWLVLFGIYYSGESWQHGFREFSRKSMIIVEVALCLACSYYYILISPKRQVNFFKLQADLFWVHGVLIFYSLRLAFDFFLPGLLMHAYRMAGVYVSVWINIFLNLLNYALWSYSFYCYYQKSRM